MALDFQVFTEANNGNKGLLCYDKYKPVIAIIDAILPKKSGLSLAKEIITKYPDGRILLLSNIDNTFIRKQSVLSGASDLLLKPFSDKECLTSIRYLMKDFSYDNSCS